jgi:hypothetical protein
VSLNQRIEELCILRDELGVLLSEWDETLAGTPDGTRAHLLESLGTRHAIERTRRQRQARTRSAASK